MLDTKKITGTEKLQDSAEIVVRLVDADNLLPNQNCVLRTEAIRVEFKRGLPSKYDKSTYDFSFHLKSGGEDYHLFGSKKSGKVYPNDLDVFPEGSGSFLNFFRDDFDLPETEKYITRIKETVKDLEHDLADTLKIVA